MREAAVCMGGGLTASLALTHESQYYRTSCENHRYLQTLPGVLGGWFCGHLMNAPLPRWVVPSVRAEARCFCSPLGHSTAHITDFLNVISSLHLFIRKSCMFEYQKLYVEMV